MKNKNSKLFITWIIVVMTAVFAIVFYVLIFKIGFKILEIVSRI